MSSRSNLQLLFLPILSIDWNPNSTFLEIGPLEIKWYGLMYAIAIMIGYMIALRAYRIDGLSSRNITTFIFYQFICAIIGARLWTVFFYEWTYFVHNPIEILMFWKGGLSSHGAIIGIFLSVILYVRKYKSPDFWWSIDVLAIVGASCAGWIRLGNLFNSEIIGKATTLLWAFVYKQVDTIPRHPVVLYESIVYFIICAWLWYLWSTKGLRKQKGLITGIFLVTALSIRILLEFLKAEAGITQMCSIPFIVLGILLIIRARKLENSNP